MTKAAASTNDPHRLRWRDLPGMPWRTRLLSLAATRARRGVADLTPEQIERDRSLTPPPRFPVTLATGPVRRTVVRTTVTVPMRDGTAIPARVHRRPDVSGDAPVLIYFHGGGWTMGRPLDYESMLTLIADETGAVVVAPDYRKAPQHKAPAAVHDAHDTVDWVLGAPDSLPVRPGKVLVGGDSAGGNLAALTAIRAGDALHGQILIYPAVDLSIEHTYRAAPLLDGPALDAYKAHYLQGAAVPADDPEISPLRAASHTGVAPALVQTAEFDPLAPEGVQYAETLRAAGVSVRSTHYRGMPHGFLNIPGLAPLGTQARWEIVDTVRDWIR